MIKVLSFFPLNKGVQRGAIKQLLISWLKYIGVLLGYTLASIFLCNLPVIGNLFYNLGELITIYCIIGIISAIVQMLIVLDASMIEYKSLKELLDNKKVLIGIAIAAVVLLVVPKSVWQAGTSSEVEQESETKTSKKEKSKAKKQDKDKEKESDKEAETDDNKADQTVEEASENPDNGRLYETPDDMKDLIGYVDENGQIVYKDWYDDSSCWWALRNYVNIKTKLPIYISGLGGDIRYEVTWDDSVNHWHLIKYYKDKVEEDEYYDDELNYPVDYEDPFERATWKARSHTHEWNFPGESVFGSMTYWDVDDYENEIYLFKDPSGKYYAGVKVKDINHLPTTYTVKADNVAEGLNDGDVLPVIMIMAYTGNDRIINIPDNIVRIDEKAFCGNTDIEEVVLPNGLESIGEKAFSGCSNLKSVSFGEYLSEIDKYAFSGCDSMECVSLPLGISYIGYADEQFGQCSSITWNGNTYSNSKDFEAAFKEDGGEVSRNYADLSEYGR